MFTSFGKSIRRATTRVHWIRRNLSSLSSKFAVELTAGRALCSNLQRVTHQPIRKFVSTSTVMYDEDRNRFRNMFLFLQAGKYEDTMNEIDRCYTEGYSLPKSDILMLVSRFTEVQRYDLIKRLSSLVASSNPPLYSEITPLFCYVLLLEGDLSGAFSLISQNGDQYLAYQKTLREDQDVSFKSSPLSLPQEFLFARLCIQLLSDIQDRRLDISPFSQSLPRRASAAEPSYLHLPEIILCYLHTCNYLIAACHHDASSVPETLHDLFPSPYARKETVRNLSQWSFSSFTLHYASQRLQSTLRSLVLFLWYSYSRSVFDTLHTQDSETPRIGMTETIEEVYESLKNYYDYWNDELFQFFTFYYSQPNPQGTRRGNKVNLSNSMRNSSVVSELLSEMGKRGISILSPLAITLFRKSDLKTESFHAIIRFFLNPNRSPVELDSLLHNNISLLREYIWECGKRNDSQSLTAFYDQLSYLNLHIDTETLNEILFVSCYTETHLLRKRIVNDMQMNRISISDTALCAMLFVECIEKEDISTMLKLLPQQLDESWKLKLTHLLLQMSPIDLDSRFSPLDDWRKSSSVNDFSAFCKQRNIRLDSMSCQCLFDWYCKERDYRNALHVFYFIKRRGLKVPSSKFNEMSQTVQRITESKKRLFGTGSVLESATEDSIQLPRQTNRYHPDKAKPTIRRALCLFKKDSAAVSINMIMDSFVREFCKSSVMNYDSWL